jgi:large subunit ribosomal protein L7/L12
MVNMPLRRKGQARDLLACRVSDGHKTVFKHRLNYGKAHLMADAQSKKAKLLAQREKLDAEIKALEAKERAQKRKDDTRRKIILGGLVMKAAEGEPNIMGWMKGLARGESVSQKDRDLLDFWFEKHAPEESPKAEQPSASAEAGQGSPTVLGGQSSG